MPEDYRVENENNKFRKLGGNTMVQVANILNASLAEERFELDGTTGNVIYQGWAAIGSGEAEAVWLISQLNYDVNGQVIARVWADGEGEFNKIWDDRATFNYTY